MTNMVVMAMVPRWWQWWWWQWWWWWWWTDGDNGGGGGDCGDGFFLWWSCYQSTYPPTKLSQILDGLTINLLARQIGNMHKCVIERRKNMCYAKHIFSFVNLRQYTTKYSSLFNKILQNIDRLFLYGYLWTESDLGFFFRGFAFPRSHARII